jgi:membrane protease YdiL (CAAX protease family)
VVGVFALVVAEILVVPVVLMGAFMAGYALWGSGDTQAWTDRLLDTSDPTPAGLAYLNLALAGAILVAWLLTRLLHGLRPGWLASVRPRIRWTWFAACLGLSIAALLATLVVSALLPAQGEGTELSGGLNDFTTTTRDFALVVLLLTPLQAAGEEYAFRGYLTQAFGGLFRQRWVAVLVPALLFALAHGAQDAPVFFDRFAFGIVAGVLAITTGGLEAGIAMHVLNNWLAFGLALAYGDMASTLNPSGGSWWSIPVTLTQSLVYLGLALLVARRMGLRTTTDPAVLEAQNPRV